MLRETCRAFGLVMLVGLSLLVVGAAWDYVETRAFLRTAVKTDGVVTEVEDGSRTVTPIVTFRDAGGHRQSARLSTGEHPVGARVAVLYNSSSPGWAREDTSWGKWAGVIIRLRVFAIGGCLALVVMFGVPRAFRGLRDLGSIGPPDGYELRVHPVAGWRRPLLAALVSALVVCVLFVLYRLGLAIAMVLAFPCLGAVCLVLWVRTVERTKRRVRCPQCDSPLDNGPDSPTAPAPKLKCESCMVLWDLW